ncbi:MAG: hypothetical protein R6X12_09100 [bacterium]
MSTARALLLALVLEAAETPGRTTFRKRKSDYFATLFLLPQDYELFGLVEAEDGLDLLWRPTGAQRPAGAAGR